MFTGVLMCGTFCHLLLLIGDCVCVYECMIWYADKKRK